MAFSSVIPVLVYVPIFLIKKRNAKVKYYLSKIAKRAFDNQIHRAKVQRAQKAHLFDAA